ncbi:MAG: amino acid adenylation domain-containing protein, partial [Pseudomonadales bacterium]|nr:amino acid adenylation domain-containing protein [Pseudomonadales bacterium]
KIFTSDDSALPMVEARESLTIDPHHANAMRAFCNDYGISVSLYLKSLYSVLIRTYCRTDADFHLYEYYGGRPAGHERSLGCYYQQVPFILPSELFKPEALLTDLFGYARQMQGEVRDKRQISISKQRQIAPQGAITFLYNYYYFDVDFSFPEEQDSSETLNSSETLKAEIASAKVESAVQLIIKDLYGQLQIDLRYDTSVFSSFDFSARLLSLSKQVIEKDVQYIGKLDLTLPNEKEFWSVCNPLRTELPAVSSVQQLFEQQVEKTPDASALTFAQETLSYKTLNERANQLAHYLREQGVEANTKVGVCVERSLEMMVSVLAVLKAGGAYVPLDITYPKERLGFLIDDSNVSLLLAQHCMMDRLPVLTEVELFFVDSQWDEIHSKSIENPVCTTTLDDLIYIIYTSGSTGLPKGAGVTHRGEINLLNWFTREFNIGADDKTLLMSAIGFDLTQKNLFAVLIKGGTLVIPPMDYYDQEVITYHIEHDEITLLNCAPSAFYPLVERDSDALKSLRTLFLGGETIQMELLSPWLRREDCHCEVVNTYGPTECTDVVSYHRVHITSDVSIQVIPIGKPIDNTQLYILDSNNLVPVGLVGELCVAGVGVGVGYLSKNEITRNELTEAVFIDNPFGEGQLYRTGDLARYLENGDIEYIGRKDFQVKLRGMRIELGEIEAALRRQPGVKDSLVMLDAKMGEEGVEQLVAYVVTDRALDNGLFDKNQWRESIRDTLPNYMIPNVLISVEAWPLTPNGKVDRKSLLNLVDNNKADSYVAPRSEIELQLVSIWSSVLKVDKIWVYDNFFDLGGHSLLATQIAARARKAFNIPIQLRDMLGQPTIDSIAKQVAKLMKGDSPLSLMPEIVRVDRTKPLPLSFAQQRLWVLDQLEPGSVAYNMPLTVKVRGALNVDVLRQSFAEVVRRHESLRTVFIVVEEDDDPDIISQDIVCEDIVCEDIAYQTIKDAGQGETCDWALPVTSVVGLEQAAQEIEVKRLVAIEIMTPFDLETGPLFRTSLFKLDENDFVFVAVTHHIVSDGWSMGLMIQEVASIYSDLSQGKQPELDELPLQYADFSQWQRNWLQGEVLERELDYWREQLKDLTYLKFPTDYPRPRVQTYQGASVHFSLTARLTKRLQLLGQRQGVTLFMTLLAAYKVLLFRYSGQDDICVGTPTANRQQEELESIIGFFINTLALRTLVDGEGTFAELLSSVQQSTMAAFDHQNVPFERIVEEVTTQRDMSRSPIFQLMFVMQNTLPLDEQLIQGAGLVFEPISPDIESAKFDITLTMREEGNLSGVFQYNTDLFTESRITEFARDFERLLAAVVDQPECKLVNLPISSEIDIRQPFFDWNKEDLAPREPESQASMGYAPPRNGLEELILVIWARVLRAVHPHQEIGIYDNFFELGGHSLLATQVISRIKRQVKIEIPLRVLFEA